MKPRPIFAAIFADDWEALPTVFHAHYANRPFTRDVVVVEGTMDVEIAWPMRLLAPLLKLTGALVPIAGRNIPVTVAYRSDPAGDGFTLDRSFRFPAREPYRFRSTMVPVGGNEVIEWMPFMLGWRAAFAWREGRVWLDHRGYAVRFRGRIYRLPIEFLLGRGEASEAAIDETRFRMIMTIRHRFFGSLYSYHGTFQIGEMDLER